VVNTTSLGLKETDGGGPLANQKFFSKHQLAIDLIYHPPQTPFLTAAGSAGAKITNGLWMLVYQGAQSFTYFFNRDPEVQIMYRAISQ